MSHCADCACWITDKKRMFANFEQTVAQAPSGKGVCRGPLENVVVGPEFGCIAFKAGNNHVELEDFRPREVYEVWEMIPCPGCCGRGCPDDVQDHPPNSTVGFSSCDRCAGTGNVRRYGDGHEGDERTRKHPIEIAKERAEKEAEMRADLERQLAELDKQPALPEPIRGSSNLPF